LLPFFFYFFDVIDYTAKLQWFNGVEVSQKASLFSLFAQIVLIHVFYGLNLRP